MAANLRSCGVKCKWDALWKHQKHMAHSTSLQSKLSKVAVAISNATFGILDLILTISMLAKVRTNGTKEASWKAKVNQARSTYPGLEQTPTCACLLSFTHFFGSESKKTKEWCLWLLLDLLLSVLFVPNLCPKSPRTWSLPLSRRRRDSLFLYSTCLKTSAGSKNHCVQ